MVGDPSPRTFGQPSNLSCLRNRPQKNDSNIILKDGDSLIADQKQVCERMNTFYVNIAKNIGIENNTPVNDKHSSIEKIKENANVSSFEFSPVTEAQVKNV